MLPPTPPQPLTVKMIASRLCLHIAIGTDAFVASRLAAAMEEAKKVLAKLPLLGDAQVEYTLLRSC